MPKWYVLYTASIRPAIEAAWVLLHGVISATAVVMKFWH